MAHARISPLPPAERDERQRELLEAIAAAGGPLAEANIFATLVRNPSLFERWLPFGGRLLRRSGLAPRERELAILRVAWRCRSPYEWGQHVGLGREAGLAGEEIARVASDLDPTLWPDAEATVLRATDELVDDHRIGDATWAALAARLDEDQLIEVPMLVGHYVMLAGVLNSLRVEPDAGLPALGEP